ncbi:CmpA/NrtA family ABC transporter substrate-binding protein [uncultured Shimia sp.]|uniref:CmpA/NrtA family ABC transporter substrate-binding protein n=1 Tax=uncultured Shimia sp. TaxID=573152 RepID=UPI0026117A74|nr:CmpA/NrtA family ABC transporter substrate-binding protein [uncultured Shimia sp.]
MTRTTLNIGYVPLVDSAPLVIAQELGFAAKEGLTLNLLKQPSWSTLRDLLALGTLDAAHMLSPLPIAMSLGLSSLRVRVHTLMVLSMNGNVIGVSNHVACAMRAAGWDGQFGTPHDTGRALLAVTDHPKVGVPFPHSMHAELVAHWLGALDNASARTRTVPPPLMAKAVEAGEVDAFCVGEPWGSVVVENKVGELILPGAAIWNASPEKVLGAREAWIDAHPNEVRALIRAVWRAGEWLAAPDNLSLASEVLARTDFLDLPEQVIDLALRSHLCPKPGALPERVPHFLRFHGDQVTHPFPSHADWIATKLARHHGLDPVESSRLAQETYRAKLYLSAVAGLRKPEEVDSQGLLEYDTLTPMGPDETLDQNPF